MTGALFSMPVQNENECTRLAGVSLPQGRRVDESFMFAGVIAMRLVLVLLCRMEHAARSSLVLDAHQSGRIAMTWTITMTRLPTPSIEEPAMDFKTMLVHVDGSRSADARFTFAARLAVAHGAHLAGIAQTGILRYVYGVPPDGYLGDATPLFDDLRAAAEGHAARFEALARQAGAGSCEYRIGDEEPGYALARQGMYADLVIVGQSDPGDAASAHAAIPDYVALHAPCPVLVLPYAGAFEPGFERILVAWNASPEAARAVRQALPFLTRAREVEVAAVERGEGGEGGEAGMGGPELALLLARHGVKVTLWQGHAGDAAAALLGRVSDSQAQLLVMGCYGHSRFRETLLGGVSRTVLRSMTVPVLMAH
jgi:nucleotide-binding universal stress UspA family protein